MWIERKMKEMIDKYGKIPSVFSPYDLIDLSHGICTTLTTANCSSYGARGGVLLNDNYTNGKDNKKEYKENKMNYNLVNFCEFDKYATKSYCAIHDVNEGLNLGDITQVDIESLPTEGVDLITHGSPCQSFSIAGKQHGGEKGSNTRSSLLWNSVEIIRHCNPKFVIWENVKNVLSKKHKPVFDAYVDEMKNMGYNTYYQVLNAKNYGIPQNRERIYAISVREDIDNNQEYTGHIDHNKYYDRFDKSLFPEPFDNGLRLRDFLEDEDEIEEKYYLSDKMVSGFLKHNENHEAKGTGFKWKPRDINGTATCLRANASLAPTDNTIKCEQIGDLNHYKNDQMNRVYSDNGLSPTITTKTGGGREVKILSDLRTPSGGHTEVKIVDDNNSVIINPLKNKTKYGWHFEQNVYDSTGLMRTLKAGGGSGNIPKIIEKEEMTNERAVNIMRNEQCCQDDATFVEAYEKAIEALETTTNSLFRIRKLTPKECYRLMGFSDEDFEKAKAVNSNSQLYKQAGNSIVVNVLEEIYKCLHNAYPNDFTKGMNVMSLFSGIGAFEKALERVDFD